MEEKTMATTLKTELFDNGYRVALCEIDGPEPRDIPLTDLVIPEEATAQPVEDFADDPLFEGALALELPGIPERGKPLIMTLAQYQRWCEELYTKPEHHYQAMLERLGVMFATLDRLGQAVMRVYSTDDGPLVLDAMTGNLNHDALAREDIIIGDSEPQASLETLGRVVSELGPELTNPS
jgi:hypothetical protein